MDTVSILNHYSNAFVHFSWIMLLQSSVLILILLGLDVLLRRKVRAVFRYCLWMLVLVKLVLPVGLALPCSPAYYASSLLPEKTVESSESLPEIADTSPVVAPAEESIPYRPVVETSAAAPAEPVTAPGTASIVPPTASENAPIPQSQPSISWQTFVSLGWLIAVLVMLGLLVQRIFFVSGLIRQSAPADEILLSQLKRCISKMGMRRHVDLRVSPNATSPSVCGLIRPVILIPDTLTDHLNAAQMDAILMHELAHIKRGDLWVNLVQALLQIIYFYNPLLWVANAVIRRIREQAVDERVLVAMDDRAEEYPQTLLNVSKLVWSKPMLSLRLIGVVESKSALTSRIKHILSRPFPKSAKLGLVGLVTIFLAAAVLLPMAKGEKEGTPVPKGGLYENAKGSKNHKIKVGPTKFEAHTVVRWHRDGNPVIMNPTGDALVNVPFKVPDFSDETKWMDIAQVYLSPEQTAYDVIELRVFNHDTRKSLTSEGYLGEETGVGYSIENSVVTIYSVGKLLPDSLDIWMRVLHRGAKHYYILESRKQAAVDIDRNTLRILDIAKGQYDWENGKRTKHHAQYDDIVTTVTVKFDKPGNKQYQICAIAKDGRRVVPDFPHFLRPSNGWTKLEFAVPMDEIKTFEITPFKGRDRFFFDDVKLPPRNGHLDPMRSVRVNINGQPGKYKDNTNPLFDSSLHVLPNTVITGIEAGVLGTAYTRKDSDDASTSIVFQTTGLSTKTMSFAAYDKDGNLLDPDQFKRHGSSYTANSACGYTKSKIPVEQIHTVDVYFNADLPPGPKRITVEESTNNYTATLPNGEIVKLIALFKPKDSPIVFWTPDGTVIDGPKLRKEDFANASDRELAYVLQRPERKYEDGHENPAPDGNFYDVHGWKEFQLESGAPLVVKRASGYGQWVDMGQIKEGLDLGGYNLTEVSQLGEQVLAKMFWKFNPEFGIRLVAVDNKGKEYPMEASDEFIGNFEQDQQMLYFHAAMGLNKKRLSHFKLQRRPLFWAKFEGFALEPKEATQNSVLDEAKAKEKLEFRIVADIATEQAQNISFPQSDLDGYIWVAIKNEDKGQQWPWYTDLPYKKVDDAIYLLVNNKPSGTMLADGSWGLQKVYPRTDAMGRSAIGFDFDEKGAELFYDLTSQHIGRRLAIIIDNVVYSAPQINSAVRGSGIITGQFNETEIQKLVEMLSVGMPPVIPLAEGQQPGFGPTIEITINDAVSVKKDSLIDFDTGKLFTLPDAHPDNWTEKTPEEVMQWLIERGIDASGASRDTIKGLLSEDMVFASMNNSYWDNVKPDMLATNNLWEIGKPGRPAYMTGKGQLPATYIFKTREGGIGVLQITGFNENPKGINIRYKMLQNYKNVSLRPGGMGGFGGAKPEGEIKFPKGWEEIAAERAKKLGMDPNEYQAMPEKMKQQEESKQELLATKISFSLLTKGTTLEQAVDLIRKSTTPPLSIIVYWKDLDQKAAIKKNTPIGIEGLGVMTLESGLRAILDSVSEGRVPADFMYWDKSILIASKESLPTNFRRENYDVSDLTVSKKDRYGKEAENRIREEMKSNTLKLKQTIIESIDHDSWIESGGQGRIEILDNFDIIGEGHVFDLGTTLRVYQTPQVHQKIKEYLSEKREELSKQIAIEARILLITDSYLEDIGLDTPLSADYQTSGGVGQIVVGPANSKEILAALEHKPLDERKLPPVLSPSDINTEPISKVVQPTQKLQTLDDLQTEFLLRATQAHAGAKQLQAPKAMVLNGESARMQLFTKPQNREFSGAFFDDPLNRDAQIQYIDIDGKEKAVTPGITFEIIPIIQPDDKKALLKGHIQMTDVLENRPVEHNGKTYEIPYVQVANIPIHAVVEDNATLLIAGPAGTITRKITGPPPEGNPPSTRLFTYAKQITERQILLILVKPTIIKQKEAEADAIGALAPRSGGGYGGGRM
jgi:beta-lactamase regulating signal transducer with metallopeptidase domain